MIMILGKWLKNEDAKWKINMFPAFRKWPEFAHFAGTGIRIMKQKHWSGGCVNEPPVIGHS